MNSRRAGSRLESARDQLIAVVGENRYHADWTNSRHRARRLLSEFIGTFGLLFVLSAGAGAITAGAGAAIQSGDVSSAEFDNIVVPDHMVGNPHHDLGLPPA